MNAPDMTARYCIRSDEVSAKIYDDEVIILDLATGLYYASTGLGARVWAALESGATPEMITEQLSAQFDLPASKASADVAGFVGALLEARLVEAVCSGDLADAARLELKTSPNEPYAPALLESYGDMMEMLALDPPMPNVDLGPRKPFGRDER